MLRGPVPNCHIKVLSVPGKVGGQVFVARGLSALAGASGLAAEWRQSKEPFKSMRRRSANPFRQLSLV